MLSLVTDTLSLVRLRRPERTDLSCSLSNFLLIYTLHYNCCLVWALKRYPIIRYIVDGVTIAQLKCYPTSLGVSELTDANDLKRLSESISYANDHVLD